MGRRIALHAFLVVTIAGSFINVYLHNVKSSAAEFRYWKAPSTINPTTDTTTAVSNQFHSSTHNVNTSGSPVRSFVFHALHKTGSEYTRNQLRTFCHREQLTCLTYCQCGICHSPSTCLTKHSFTEYGQYVESGSFTVARMRDAKCCAIYNQMETNGVDGVVEHLPLSVPGNRDFLERVIRPNAFRFTIVRDPINQFLSYYNMLTHIYAERYKVKVRNVTLNTVLDLFWQVWHTDSLHALPSEYHIMHALLTNSQSKELGWSGNRTDMKSLKDTLQYLGRLDYIGFTDDFEQTWNTLRHKLHWSSDYFTSNVPPSLSPYERGRVGIIGRNRPKHNVNLQEAPRIRKTLTTELLRKICDIQFADLMLFEEAKRLAGYS